MKHPKLVVLGATALGLGAAAGAWLDLPRERLWMSVLWCGAAALILGWAAGHAVGRLRHEARARAGPPGAGASPERITQREDGAPQGA